MSNTYILSRPCKDTIVECTACNHLYKISLNNTGICGIRKNINGKLTLLVHGKVLGLHIDPVEKKPLYHFLPGTEIFSFGNADCKFTCQFCQNWNISQAKTFPTIIDQGKKLESRQSINVDLKSLIVRYGSMIYY